MRIMRYNYKKRELKNKTMEKSKNLKNRELNYKGYNPLF